VQAVNGFPVPSAQTLGFGFIPDGTCTEALTDPRGDVTVTVTL
jgi:hypothetical protein